MEEFDDQDGVTYVSQWLRIQSNRFYLSRYFRNRKNLTIIGNYLDHLNEPMFELEKQFEQLQNAIQPALERVKNAVGPTKQPAMYSSPAYPKAESAGKPGGEPAVKPAAKPAVQSAAKLTVPPAALLGLRAASDAPPAAQPAPGEPAMMPGAAPRPQTPQFGSP